MKAHIQKQIFGAAIPIEGCKIGSWRALDGYSFSRRDPGVKLRSDLLRNLALNREHVFHVTIVFLCPDVRISARVDQLHVDMEPRTSLAHTSVQKMRYT